MTHFIQYEVTNIKTGEKFVGTAVDISNKLGVSRGYITQCESEGKRICIDWKVEKVDKNVIVNKPDNYYVPFALWQDWDKTTAAFKKVSIRKRNRVARINHA